MRRKAKPACDPDVGEAAEARPRLGPDPRPGALRRFHACAQVEADATVKEIRRKASKIAPAYNKGALQYLPEPGYDC